MHVSFDGHPVTLYITSPFIALIDPLVLDGHRHALAGMQGASFLDLKDMLARLSGPLRTGLREVEDFRPGFVRISHADLERVENGNADPRVVDVESGSIVFVDLAQLPTVAAVLTWERYDQALQSPDGDLSAFAGMLADPERPSFAVLSAHVGTPFDGDGAYRLRSILAGA